MYKYFSNLINLIHVSLVYVPVHQSSHYVNKVTSTWNVNIISAHDLKDYEDKAVWVVY